MKRVTYHGDGTITAFLADGTVINFSQGETVALDDQRAESFAKRGDFTVAEVTPAPWPPAWDPAPAGLAPSQPQAVTAADDHPADH